MQKHWDVMRSDDAGDSWCEVSGNLPSDFGFPIEVHAHEPPWLTELRKAGFQSSTQVSLPPPLREELTIISSASNDTRESPPGASCTSSA